MTCGASSSNRRLSFRGRGSAIRTWWTRNERTRTVAGLPFEASLQDPAAVPAYQRLAGRAAGFRVMGWSDHSIAVQLDVTDKTIAKAIRWLRG